MYIIYKSISSLSAHKSFVRFILQEESQFTGFHEIVLDCFRSSEDDFEAVEDSANLFLAKTIHSMEEKMNNAVVHENAVDEIPNFGDNVGSGNAYFT